MQLDAPGFVLTTLKRAEDDNSLVLRGYETLGRAGEILLTSWIPLKEVHETDAMEWQNKGAGGILPGGKTVRLSTGANEIKTWKISLRPE
jgi:alpha-mannosidase